MNANDKGLGIQSQGGIARAARLSSEDRRAIARGAAEARWGTHLPRATHDGDLSLCGTILKAAVLPGGKRLLTQATFLVALGRSPRPPKGMGGLTTFDELPVFLQAEHLKPFITNDLIASSKPEFFRLKDGQRAVGYAAELLPKVCEVYLRFRDWSLAQTGKTPARYARLINACDVLMRGLAHTGIVALVDEATGYQYDRARDALARILEQFIAEELRPWTRTFPLEFYEQIFRLKGWPFDPATMQGPRALGNYTNNIVYARLAPGVLEELKRKNPVVDGRRRHKHFQWLTGEIGHPKLLAHLEGVKIIMRESSSWDDFLRRLNRHYPIITTTELGFEIELAEPRRSHGERRAAGQLAEASASEPALLPL